MLGCGVEQKLRSEIGVEGRDIGKQTMQPSELEETVFRGEEPPFPAISHVATKVFDSNSLLPN